MPITNPTLSAQVAGYVAPTLKERMERIRRHKPRFTMSWQIEQSLEAHIDTLEAQAGLKPLKKFTPAS